MWECLACGMSYITFAYIRQISYDLSRIDGVPQYDRMIAATNESEVIDISPDLPLVWEEDLVVAQPLLLAGVQEPLLQLPLEPPQAPDVVVASDYKDGPDVNLSEIRP